MVGHPSGAKPCREGVTQLIQGKIGHFSPAQGGSPDFLHAAKVRFTTEFSEPGEQVATEARKGEGRRVADRIDFAAIQEKDGIPIIVFFEAKRFVNKKLRSKAYKLDTKKPRGSS